MKWFVKCIKNYVNFTGRARRSEYWYFILFGVIFSIAAMLIDRFVIDSSVISPLYSLFIFLPQLAVMVRRLHDTEHSGTHVLLYYIAGIMWCILLFMTGITSIGSLLSGGGSSPSIAFLIILIGGGLAILAYAIVMLVWFCTPGTPGENKYGPDPKTVEEL